MPETSDLPGGSAQPGLYQLYRQGLDAQILEWAKTAVREGESINQEDPSYKEVDQIISYISGNRMPTSDMPLGRETEKVRSVQLNFIKRVIRRHASALTDIKPMFQWRTKHPELKAGANLLNQYTIIWWVNTFADVEIGRAAKWALTGGAGDIVVEFDPYYHGGETRISARDWRNTIPIRPGDTYQSIQDWEGVIIRESHPINQLLARYPNRAHVIKPDTGSLPVVTRPKNMSGMLGSVLGRPPRTLSGRGIKDPGRQRADKIVVPQCTFYRMFLKDRSVNQSNEKMLIGQLGSSWSYWVRPGAPLYPNGRMILFTEHGIIYDGANPYWHGMFPITRLSLDPWPWLFVGLGLIHELKDTNDAINYVVNDLLRLLAKKVAPPTRYDRNMPLGFRKRHDPRAPAQKILKPSNFQAGVEFDQVEDIPQWAMPLVERLVQVFHELSGVANLESLLQLRQAPGRDTLEKFIEALTPEMRLEGRQMEVMMRELAHMVRSNFFQFQSAARTFSIVGDSAAEIKDLDYDPDTHIPAYAPGSPEAAAIPELAATRPLHERARYFSKQFSFYVSPSSLMAIHATEQKLTHLQLSRQGMVDIWTLAEKFDIPNMGQPPPMLLPVRDQAAIKQAVESNQPIPMEVRIPETITERLIAQAQLGIGQTVNPAGRKATAQEAPSMRQRGDGSPIVSESG